MIANAVKDAEKLPTLWVTMLNGTTTLGNSLAISLKK
jgi:hypothetical protein